jgi:DNA polymerase III delta prime subunit
MHHAVLIEDQVRSVEDLCKQYIQGESIELSVFPSTTIGIDEARRLSVEATRTPLVAPCRGIVVEVTSLTSEAQNALLKLLEEPPATTRFLFIVRAGVSLLPTLRSRLHRVEVVSMHDVVASAPSAFAAGTIAQRLALIQERLDKKDDDWLHSLRREVEHYLKTEVLSGVAAQDIAAMHFVLSRLGTRGASNKMLLEELAFTMPRLVTRS